MEVPDDDDDEGGDEGAPAWMATFSDLATLLLTFFVLLLSFAELNVVEFKQFLGSIRDAFGVQNLVQGDYEAMAADPVDLNMQPTQPIVPITADDNAALALVRKALRRKHKKGSIEVVMQRRGIVVRIKDQILFSPGSDELSSKAGPVLDDIYKLTEAIQSNVTIEGHTDNVPIHNLRFPSNWELSAGRAASVLRYLLQHHPIEPERVRIAGYADTRPVEGNDTSKGRASNRRVEFVFERGAAKLEAKSTEEAQKTAETSAQPTADEVSNEQGDADKEKDAPDAETEGAGTETATDAEKAASKREDNARAVKQAAAAADDGGGKAR
ncbi:MAG: OmpA family protein [Polyangiales bacterium]